VQVEGVIDIKMRRLYGEDAAKGAAETLGDAEAGGEV